MSVDPERATAAFVELAGRAPDGVWAAPGRVNLIGEHTDYNDGFVLPIAIERTTAAAVAARDDSVVRCLSLQEGRAPDAHVAELGPGRSDGWAAYAHGVVWALREAGIDVRGADVVVDSDVPEGSGLSSSAALECAVALALAELAGATVEPFALARLAQRAEVEAVGVPSGIMDQATSILGRAGHALFLDTRSQAREEIPLRLEESGLRLLVVDTKAPRRLADGAYAERRATCEAAARTLGVPSLRDVTPERLDELTGVQLRRARHVVGENARVLRAVEVLRNGQVRPLGPLFDDSHRSLRDDYEVSSPVLDTAVEAARAAGAVGARMTGAGFGGCAVALVPEERVVRVEEEVRNAFAAAGFAAPDVFPVTASDGARRVA